MGFWGDAWDYTKRGAKAVITSGASELYPQGSPQAQATATSAIAENDQRRQQYAQDLANYQNRQAPQLGQAARADVPQLAPQQVAQMPQMPAAQRAAGTVAYAANQASATPVGATQLGPVSTFAASDPGRAETAQAANATASGGIAQQVNTGGQVRDEQMGANALLKGAATGAAPSVAELQMQRGTAANIAANFAMARSAKGYGKIGALENAQDNAQQANAELVGRQAELRAGEMAQARGQYAQALSGVRGQDIGAETTNAQLGTQVSLANAGMATDVSKFNAGTNTAANQFNANQVNQREDVRARFAQDANVFNSGAMNTQNLAQGQINANAASQASAQGTDISKFNAGAGDAMNRFNETTRQQNEQFNTDLEAQRQRYAAGLGADLNKFNAGQGNDLNKFGVQTAADIGKFNASETNDQTTAQADFQTRWAAMDDAQKRAYMDFISQSQSQSIQGAVGLAGAERQGNQDQWNQTKDIFNVAKGVATGQATSGGA